MRCGSRVLPITVFRFLPERPTIEKRLPYNCLSMPPCSASCRTCICVVPPAAMT